MDSSTENHATSSSSEPPEPPRSLCLRGCGFFGTAENRGFCSKCYSDYLKQEMAKSESAIISGGGGYQISSAPQPAVEIKSESEISKLIEALNTAAITEIDKMNSPNSNPPPPIAKSRCGCCNKKVGLLGFVCRCGETFCRSHRYPEAHPCNFDFKSAGKIAIAKENPVCKADKISDRV
ncbi:hypothetical protein BUALT_Bualt06G0123900 [Buddleja alternifolia]|uniref:Uncharacterized protein n=1 Tax=Buddleja alternifolia TaxID=168488 RepID=A0AAV6XMH6_9LAMI|nr:hypothetical protein BUALT_Bualt06G0123900 [Buddleja alternifolia]